MHAAEGMGTNKKVAKRNAAENMLELLGFKVPQPQPPKPALKTEEKVTSCSVSVLMCPQSWAEIVTCILETPRRRALSGVLVPWAMLTVQS